ncbi:hypothetical protein BH10ACT1_BH10ACT1_22080 [soil metagenome]
MAATTLPRAARRTVAAATLVAMLTLLSACLSTTQTQVQSELNADRRAHGLSTLGIQNEAQAKAQAWANRLAAENRLYHSNLPDGIRSRWCSLGENVGYGPSVPAIEDAYMNSPGHRANILSTKWNAVGVGVAKNGSRVYTVQVFIKTC